MPDFISKENNSPETKTQNAIFLALNVQEMLGDGFHLVLYDKDNCFALKSCKSEKQANHEQKQCGGMILDPRMSREEWTRLIGEYVSK